MNRNARYEQRKKAQGLIKVTIWIPANLETEYRLLAEATIQNRDLSFNSLRDTKSGKYVSLERFNSAVTGDGVN